MGAHATGERICPYLRTTIIQTLRCLNHLDLEFKQPLPSTQIHAALSAHCCSFQDCNFKEHEFSFVPIPTSLIFYITFVAFILSSTYSLPGKFCDRNTPLKLISYARTGKLNITLSLPPKKSEEHRVCINKDKWSKSVLLMLILLQIICSVHEKMSNPHYLTIAGFHFNLKLIQGKNTRERLKVRSLFRKVKRNKNVAPLKLH